MKEQFGECGKVLNYIEQEYKYTEEELKMVGPEFYTLMNELMNNQLLDPKNPTEEKLMTEAVDNFFLTKFDSHRRRTILLKTSYL
jgi:hypothetical protein